MNIVNYGYFEQYQEGPYLLYKNAEGKDWNQMQRGDENNPPIVVLNPSNGSYVSSIHPTWALVAQDGTLTNVEIDPSTLVPYEKTVLGIDAPIETIQVGMIYDGTNIVAAPPAPIFYSIPKMLPWDRMTDDEADIFDGWLSQTSAKYRNMYNAAIAFDYNQTYEEERAAAGVTTLWAGFYAALKNSFGKPRAQALMASIDGTLVPVDPN